MANPFRFRIFWGEYICVGTSCRPHFGFRFRFSILAERAGFEPAKVLPLHAFQACALGHYATSPLAFNLLIIDFLSRNPLGCFKCHSRFIASCFVKYFSIYTIFQGRYGFVDLVPPLLCSPSLIRTLEATPI